ncbi:MAG TPA: ComEC/Rec2 family competence protein [Pyrinomonadaceae bacterium]|nr:ComEC/Rec2 family competence protein [Pyrinomonadaceae bacterium]
MNPVPHTQRFFAHPLAQLAIAFGAGILAAPLCLNRLGILITASALTTLVAAAALLKHKVLAATFSITVAFTLAGACLAIIEKQEVRPERLKSLIDQGLIAAGEPVELTGVLERPSELAPASLYLILRVEQCRYLNRQIPASGVVSLMAVINEKASAEEYQKLQLRYGTRIRIRTTLNRTDNYRNPGVSLFTEYLERKGYDATGLIKSPLLIERLGDQRVFPPLAWLYEWRQQVEAQINLYFSRETAAVLNASLVGNRNLLSRATAERFRDGGTFHVLVISGWHISVIGGLVFLIARRFTKNRVKQFLLSTSTVWCYAIAVGADASVIRAALMFTFLTCAPVIGRHGVSLNTLGAAALVLLIWRPSSLFDPSFQLTFLSVLAIVVLAWPLLKRLSEIGSWRPTRETSYPPVCAPWLRCFSELLFWSEHKWKQEMAQLNYSYRLIKDPRASWLENSHLQRLLRYAFASILVSLSVQLMLLPLFIVYFHRVSLSALILNVGVSLAMALLSLVAVLALIMSQFSLALAGPLIGIADGLNWLMTHSVDPFMRLGASSLRVPQYSGGAALIYVFYYVPLIVLATRLSRWKPLDGAFSTSRRSRKVTGVAVLVQIAALVVIILHPLSTRRINGWMEVDFLDVGQGDAALVTMPDGTTLLVDGGGRSNFMSRKRTSDSQHEEVFQRDTRSIGEAVVSEHLWWRGLDHVDYIVATHMDADHVDGLNDVLRNFSVRSALTARTPQTNPEFRKFYETTQSEGVPINLIGTGDVLRVGDASARVLWPMASRNLPSQNNDSLVLRLEFGNHKILLTGDIERTGEAALLATNSQDYLDADVVKAPHHGSKSSSTAAFVKATGARFVIVSVGQSSIFGHPHKEVVERWQNSGAKVLTTGKSGMISVRTDGRNLWLETFVRNESSLREE